MLFYGTLIHLMFYLLRCAEISERYIALFYLTPLICLSLYLSGVLRVCECLCVYVCARPHMFM